MKINDTQRIGAYRSYQQQNDNRVSGATSKHRKDEVQISAEAMELLGSQRAEDPGRAARLESLKNEVSTGTYHVEAGELAEKLLPFIR
ncbi:MAG: flagellar biosynthesis anti-sigma factor FlgM [Candidatus Cohnella colombiensis]|uniref:Negative regulator of flagellin synthesis n=1 Tax=Candidatus Cohnella colombiensis TaxID=3121368 RepID=A0AA95JFL6_9BACL|nr:MAG: flagellar biosynthesis anti-sigma factor FlgM [Cohnella sp.]